MRKDQNKIRDQKDPGTNILEPTIVTDPQGSYTGLPADSYEVPVQDADDL